MFCFHFSICWQWLKLNMASARKKLDEKNLKILRELVSLPQNKHCFDCHQRGPTYVNVTTGAFVCTRCSGLLRGLTPPHRVKSISMATFTSEEIDLLRGRGNEYCRKVWLGLYDGEEITKDEQRIKEFMIAKYERKRYYIKPSDSEKGSNFPSSSSSSHVQNISRLPVSSNISFPSHSVNNNTSKNRNNNVFSSQQILIKQKETLKVPDHDPFTSPNLNVSATQPTDNFANFDNNPIFNAIPSDVFSVTNSVSQPHMGSKNQPPNEDRYAALKDLDSLMKSQTQQSTETNNSTASVEWDSSNKWSVTSSFSQPPTSFDAPLAPSHKDLNPFSVGNTEVSWSNNSVGNPFNADFSWNPANGQINTTGIPSSQSLHFNSTKHWNLGVTPNPFTVSSNGQSVSHHSSNPFL